MVQGRGGKSTFSVEEAQATDGIGGRKTRYASEEGGMLGEEKASVLHKEKYRGG